jgi:hypothetical protein
MSCAQAISEAMNRRVSAVNFVESAIVWKKALGI